MDETRVITKQDLRRAVARAQAEVVEIDDTVGGGLVIAYVRFNARTWEPSDYERRRAALEIQLSEQVPFNVRLSIRIAEPKSTATGGVYR